MERTDAGRCRRLGCSSTELYPLAVPFARKPPNLPRRVRPLDGLRITIALRILDDAAHQAQHGPVATPAVQLSLYVLHSYLRDAWLVREFWQAARAPKEVIGHSCHQVLRWMHVRLREQGWIGPEIEVRYDRPANDGAG